MTTLICPIFYFSALFDSHVFVFEFNKGLEYSKFLTKTILSSFNLSNKRIAFFLFLNLCLLSSHLFFLFLFFFLCHVTFSHDFLSGIFAMPMVFPLTFA